MMNFHDAVTSLPAVKMYIDLARNQVKRSISYTIACPPRNDSDQPAQMKRLIRVIDSRFMGTQTSKLSLEDDRGSA